MRLATEGDVVLAGFRLTREEWDDLDDVSRALLLEAEDEHWLVGSARPIARPIERLLGGEDDWYASIEVLGDS